MPGLATIDKFTPLPCLKCGACCFSTASNYVSVTGADWARLGPDTERWAKFSDNHAFMRMTDGHCAALVIRPAVDSSAGVEYFCAVYDKRPQVCRNLSRGSPECHAEWTRKRATAEGLENLTR